jgi:hypothetical protein
MTDINIKDVFPERPKLIVPTDFKDLVYLKEIVRKAMLSYMQGPASFSDMCGYVAETHNKFYGTNLNAANVLHDCDSYLYELPRFHYEKVSPGLYLVFLHNTTCQAYLIPNCILMSWLDNLFVNVSKRFFMVNEYSQTFINEFMIY